jgi:hypothetical protein
VILRLDARSAVDLASPCRTTSPDGSNSKLYFDSYFGDIGSDDDSRLLIFAAVSNRRAFVSIASRSLSGGICSASAWAARDCSNHFCSVFLCIDHPLMFPKAGFFEKVPLK